MNLTRTYSHAMRMFVGLDFFRHFRDSRETSTLREREPLAGQPSNILFVYGRFYVRLLILNLQ